MNTGTGGFTIIEILVSILILGLLMAVLSALMTGSLKMNQQSQRQVNTTSEAQRIMEDTRNAWNTKNASNEYENYNKACAPGLTVPAGYTVKFINLNSRAQPLTSSGTVATTATGATSAAINDVNNTATCTAATGATVGTPATSPTMRRIQVSSGTGAQDTSLTLDILRPQE